MAKKGKSEESKQEKPAVKSESPVKKTHGTADNLAGVWPDFFSFDIFDYTMLGLIVFHVLLNPYTKVEETFITNNMYDHLVYGLDIPKYDFHEFPGVVERSFIPSLIISYIVQPFHHLTVTYLNWS